MKLKKVTINKLFGVFDHEVSLNGDSGITIVIGENGLGKTVLLEMIEAFFRRSYLYFNKVTFESMTLEFDDRVKWVIQKKIKGEDLAPMLILTQASKGKRKNKPIELVTYTENDYEIMARRIAFKIPSLMRLGSRLWKDRTTGERLRSKDLIEKYSSLIPHYSVDYDVDDLPKWFTSRHSQIKVSLIETQRLIFTEDREEKSLKRTVEKYSDELAKQIKSFLSESTELSSKLDRTYPNRLIERLKKTSDLSDEYLNQELKRLERKRELLDKVGLIEIEKDSNILEIEKPQKDLREVFMLYVEDSFKKLEIFDPMTTKIEILISIINKRFKHKKLYIDKETGFLFKSTIIKDKDDIFQRIPVSKLSSGEQNELVLFYLLLFKTEPNSLILIDEPEVSLHISWQNSFIEDLKEIRKLNNLDFVIATHSPDIIANNWELRIELKGLE